MNELINVNIKNENDYLSNFIINLKFNPYSPLIINQN